MNSAQPTPSDLQALTFRCIGPPRGGRVVAVAGHPTEPATFYFGACAGGVWQTTDGGAYWENITDGYFTSSAVGALAVAPSDPNVIYAGTGEASLRLDVSWGDGVYKSTDGGQTWANVGLRATRHIAKVVVHPQNPDWVYVAALGHAFGPSDERGVFRSQDGGKSWQQVLFKSAKAGAIDLTMDATNPRILYAALYEVYRNFWELSSGGPDSGLWQSVDGGDTWREITNNPGLPSGLKGKIGVTVSPANSNRVWAIIEAADAKAGVYRTDNRGATWEQVSSNRELIQRPWYYCHIFADPQDADTVYINNLKMWKSVDGGKNYSEITTPHGDNHDLWIDPQNPRRMINGNDGGACVSFNGGASWSTIYNQLTAQFYRLDVDNRFPYHVYGTQQDNSSIGVPSATEKGGIAWTDCYAAGTGESGFIAVHPVDPNIVYVGAVGSSPGGGGALQRYDHRTQQLRLVTVWPELYTGWGAGDFQYRFPWTFPICFSPHDPNILYSTGNHVFRSTDEGSSWQVISPDLTRNDPSKLKASGGPLTLDTSGAEHYCCLSTLAESPHQPGVLWAGSDDGLIHISHDHGASWQAITPPDLLEWSYVSTIDLSPHDAATAYVAATRYKLADDRPYLYKTSDYGATWQRIDGDFPPHEITRVIRVDPVQPGLLYVGTETGIYFSQDDGATWQRLQTNLPVVPVYDLKVKGDDLVVATHGRSFWVLDDVTPLRTFPHPNPPPLRESTVAGEAEIPSSGASQTSSQSGEKKIDTLSDQQLPSSFGEGWGGVQLLPPKATTRLTLGWSVNMARGPGKNYMMGLGAAITFTEEKGPNGETVRKMLDAGENPPQGVIVYYRLPPEISEQLGVNSGQLAVSLRILDAAGAEIKTFVPKAAKEALAKAGKPVEERTLPVAAGLNRFIWDMRYPDAVKAIGDVFSDKATTGAIAPPGQYQVQLTVGEQSWTQPFTILADPRMGASAADLQAQFALWQQIVDKTAQVHSAFNRIRRIREQVTGWQQRTQENAAITEAATGLLDKLSVIERELVQVEGKSASDRLRLPSRLNVKLIGLISVVACADARPPQQAYTVFGQLSRQADTQLALLDGLLGDDLPAFNDLVRKADVTPVIV